MIAFAGAIFIAYTFIQYRNATLESEPEKAIIRGIRLTSPASAPRIT